MKRRGAAAVGVLVALLSVPGVARAQETPHDKAIAAFNEGRRHIEAGNCDAAVTKLTESLKHEATVGARVSIAECWEKTDPLAAWRMLKDAGLQALTRGDDRLPVIEQRAAALEKRLPTIRIAIQPSVVDEPGFELRVDGELVDRYWFKTGVIATTAGRHVVEATTPHRTFSEQIAVDPSGTTNVSVTMRRGVQPPSTAATPPADAPRGSASRTLGLTLGAVGIAGLAAGTVFGILTLDKKSSIEEACGGNVGDCRATPGSVDAERESAQTTGAISTGSFIAGGVALIAGATLFFTAPSSSTNRARLAPSFARGGFLLGGTF